jgi:hypothetical protein
VCGAWTVAGAPLSLSLSLSLSLARSLSPRLYQVQAAGGAGVIFIRDADEDEVGAKYL